MVAILGKVGSGKSTLLNAICHRLEGNLRRSGKIYYNNHIVDKNYIKLISQYVPQDDTLNPFLTVYETLYYTGKLKRIENIEKRIDEILINLQLEKCRNHVVGDITTKGLSGGEKRKLSIAIELLSFPKILFLDEPISKLDSVSANTIIEQLEYIKKNYDCKIILTIHQPSNDIINKFDRMIVMKDGNITYNGRPREDSYNILSDIIQTSDIENFQSEPNESSECNILNTQVYSEHQISLGIEDSTSISVINSNYFLNVQKYRTYIWFYRFYVLFNRSLRDLTNRINMYGLLYIQSIMFGLLLSSVFSNIGIFQSSIKKRLPSLFFITINQSLIGINTTINVLSSDLDVVRKERMSGLYTASEYFIAKTLVESIIQIPMTIIFGSITYWLIGFQHDTIKFLIYLLLLVLCNQAAISVAFLLGSVFRKQNSVNFVLPFSCEFARLFGGWFLSPKDIPHYFKFIDFLSYVKYGFVGLSLNELTDLQLQCNPDELNNNICPITNGEQLIEKNGYNEYSIFQCIYMLLIFSFVCRCLSYIVIKFKHV
jgi:ABC-type multidrug transport system ATPase subunit/ABC-type multidrug transport system permease subunit